MPDDPIAVLVLEELQRRSMTISMLARKTGIGRNIVGRWLSGRRTIRLSAAVKVMRVLELSVVRGSHDSAHLQRVPAAQGPGPSHRRPVR